MQAVLTLRRLELAHLPTALRLTQEQNWSHRLEDWQFHVSLGRGWALCDRAGELLGTAIWWAWGATFGTVGFVLVRKDRQGQGIGARLMDAILEDAGPRTLQLVATRAGLGTYRRLGFVERDRILQCQGDLAARPDVTEPPGVSLRAVNRDDLDSLFELDARASGASRSALVRAVYEAGQTGVVASRAGVPAGYALQRLSGRGHVIGPVVAEDETLAIALTAHLLAWAHGFTRIDIPADATRLEAVLATAGITCVDRLPLMIRGEPPAKHTGRVFGVASQALG